MTFGHKRAFGFTTMMSLVAFVLLANNSAFGVSTSEGDPEIKASDELKKNPLIMKILKNIEISKKKVADVQKKQKAINEQKKFLETQRKIADEIFKNNLARMNKNMENFTPRASFSKFVSGLNATHQDIFWSQFNYHEQKVNLARAGMNDALKNGKSYQEARQVYSKIASMSRTEIIGLIKDLNVQHGFANVDVQKTFDVFGKLPRTKS
ncbi:MAG TPA: hypothetical protein VLD38_07270 [Nitrosopumilaceae archaeon]|nr:hypothetical protein [Nitrosopumilaceae archaeon]